MPDQETVSLPFLRDLFLEQLQDPRIQILTDVDPPHLRIDDRWRVLFSVRCDCGTSALLYLDVGKDKSAENVREATPQLLKGLSSQADQFQRMPCDLHQKMRLR